MTETKLRWQKESFGHYRCQTDNMRCDIKKSRLSGWITSIRIAGYAYAVRLERLTTLREAKRQVKNFVDTKSI